MATFFNTTQAPSMIPNAIVIFDTLTNHQTVEVLQEGFENVANPSHGNTLDAVSRILEVDVRQAKGGKVRLNQGDVLIVAEVQGLPRETREFTDDEVAKATFVFRRIEILRVK